MAPVIHVVDPNADTIILLKKGSAKFAQWEVSAQAVQESRTTIAQGEDDWPPGGSKSYTKSQLKKLAKSARNRLLEEPSTQNASLEESSTSLFGNGAATAAETYSTSVVDQPLQQNMLSAGYLALTGEQLDSEDVYYYVSSRHLMLASPWFQRALTEGGWSESGRSDNDERFHITAEDWDADAFLILINAFHLRNKQVPRTVSLEMLAKIAVLVDYYDCGEAIELYANIWVDELKVRTVLTPTYCRDTVLWTCIAWVFDRADQLQSASAVAIKNSTESFQTLELPIPTRVSGKYLLGPIKIPPINHHRSCN
jgi:hypothetical protein